MTVQQRLADLHERGFDRSSASGRDESGRFSRAIRVKCSQCEAAVINGVPCHEQRCPNEPRDLDNDWEDE